MTDNEHLTWLEGQARHHEALARDIRLLLARLRETPTTLADRPKRRRSRALDGGMTSIVREVIVAAARPLKRREVWEQVERRGVVSASSNPKDLLSSTLTQLVKSGAVVKTDEGYAPVYVPAAPSEA